jgi:hypothetical protein
MVLENMPSAAMIQAADAQQIRPHALDKPPNVPLLYEYTPVGIALDSLWQEEFMPNTFIPSMCLCCCCQSCAERACSLG